jgi:CRP/FNR family transcriptional regulator
MSNIQPELLRAFEGNAQVRNYRKGATVYRRGRAVRGLFLIHKGRARITLANHPSSLALHIAGPGSLLGLDETMSGCRYEATVETLERCEIAFLRREDFLAYLRQNCTLCMQLVQLLSEDLHQLYERYRTIAGPVTRNRKSRANGSAPKPHSHGNPFS